jgi:methionyl-tRNA synthetase
LNTVLYTTAELLRVISGLLVPIMPEKMLKLRKSIGLTTDQVNIKDLKNWGVLKAGSNCIDAGPLFPRVDIPKQDNNKKKNNSKKKVEKKQENPVGLITIDDFFKAQLKTAEILEAKKVEGADKLLLLQIAIGEDKRQIVAGIAQFYSPEDIIGKKIIIVANLKPAKIRGIESQGMLLAAKNKKNLTLVTLSDDTPSGLSVG